MNSISLLGAMLVSITAVTAQVYVAPGGSDLGAGTAGDPFLTINHAATVVAAGGTIHLLPGIYGDEQGVVVLGNKDLVLQGDGVATTVLQPHATMTVNLTVAEPGSAVVLPHRVGIVVTGAASVHVRDLTIAAARLVPASGRLVGVYLAGGADVVLDRVAISGCRPPVLGAGSTQAVAVRGDVPTDATTLVARGCAFTDFGDAGVAGMLRAEVELSECAIAGVGLEAGSVDQVGIAVLAGAIANVRHCRVADCGGGDGAALRFDGHGAGCAIEGNRVARAHIGVDLRTAPAGVAPGSVRRNRIAEVDTAIRVRGTGGIVLEDNGVFTYSRHDPLPCHDDTVAANLWHRNRYPVPPGTAALTIPGGGNVDAAPVAGTTELVLQGRIACGGPPLAVVAADFDGDG
ncbi:MAG: hypothetical protein KDC98_25090, partial [Planctomycetes bacterium]|nr:hypothetical protein [Planctomycetota bacterium]